MSPTEISSEVRGWILLLFAVVGGVITLLAYRHNQKQRRLENSFRFLALFNKWGQSNPINIFPACDRLGLLLTAASRQLSETQALTAGPTGSFTYQYDGDGNLERHTRPDGSLFDYEYT